MILIDSSVLIDLLEESPEWHAWSSDQLFLASCRDTLGINALIFAEISRSFIDLRAVSAFLKATKIQYLDIPPEAAFLAQRAHQRYRALGGQRMATHPDFFIGAHASVNGYALMTRDAKRIETYFPDVERISPRSDRPDSRRSI